MVGGGRRGAVYLTAGVALNPYDTQVEYAGGLSFSWRYLMISPLYHLGHATHLIDGETVGQTWCDYGGTATATSSPPLLRRGSACAVHKDVLDWSVCDWHQCQSAINL